MLMRTRVPPEMELARHWKTTTGKYEILGHLKEKKGVSLFTRLVARRGLGTAGAASHGKAEAYLVRASSSDSNVFCRLSSSINVTVTSFSLGFDSATEMGGVTPKYLLHKN